MLNAKTRKGPVQVEASLHLSIYSYATALNGLADQEDLRLFRLVSEILHAIDASAFHPVVGWHCQSCPYRGCCWAGG